MASHDLELSARQKDSGNDNFEHTQLDTTRNSIRLLRILPDLSSTGLIQCKIWHTTTDAEYTCLSYVWGTEAYQQVICINGKRFSCRKNLWDFLNVARTNDVVDLKAVWIDAVCVDQDNVTERNHQVSQMGDIYARATNVIAWLGRDQGAVEFFIFLKRFAAEQPHFEKDARRVWFRESTKSLQRSYLGFESNEYWTRAWITQEILQPQKLSVLVNDTQIRQPEFKALVMLLPTLQLTVSKPGRKSSDDLIRNTDRRFEIYIRAMAGHGMCYRQNARYSEPLKKALLDLLFFLGPRRCQHPRDQMYSLLAVAEDATRLRVDYSMAEHWFILSLLWSYNQSMCLCSLARLSDVLDCVGPFTSLAPQRICVPFFLAPSMTWEEGQFTSIARMMRGECYHEILVDTAKEHVFCLSQICNYILNEGHLIVPKNSKTSQSGTMSIIKIVTQEKEGSLGHPLRRVHPVDVLYFGPEMQTADDPLLEPSLYLIVLPLESLVEVSLKATHHTRPLCVKAEDSQGGFGFWLKDGFDASKLGRRILAK
jgi:hypothetical protein